MVSAEKRKRKKERIRLADVDGLVEKYSEEAFGNY